MTALTAPIVKRKLHQALASRYLSRSVFAQPMVILSQRNNIIEHLAAENALLDIVGKQKNPSPILFLWRNNKTVVIGRHQNAWSECNLEQMALEDAVLSRRTTGGGAVYQDMGNTCFSFVGGSDSFSKCSFANLILRVLREDFGLTTAAATGRNDLVLTDSDGCERKFSGTASRLQQNTWLYHGTLLRSADLGALGRFLTPHAQKLKSKATRSVAARVINLNELAPNLEHTNFCEKLASRFLCSESGKNAERTTSCLPSWLRESEEYNHHLGVLQSWNWRYGNAPHFTNCLVVREEAVGTFEFHLSVSNGLLEKMEVFSDALDTQFVQTLHHAITANLPAKFDHEHLSGSFVKRILDDMASKSPTEVQSYATPARCILNQWSAEVHRIFADT